MDAHLTTADADEQAVFISILENQRNVATTELARMAARIATLEGTIVKLRMQQEKDRV